MDLAPSPGSSPNALITAISAFVGLFSLCICKKDVLSTKLNGLVEVTILFTVVRPVVCEQSLQLT